MAYNPYSLEDKTILVTGAGSGIGRATAIECSRLGARLVLVDINGDALNETLASLEAQEREHMVCVVNLCDEAAIQDMVKQLPVLDGCSHNAGITNLVPSASTG